MKSASIAWAPRSSISYNCWKKGDAMNHLQTMKKRKGIRRFASIGGCWTTQRLEAAFSRLRKWGRDSRRTGATGFLHPEQSHGVSQGRRNELRPGVLGAEAITTQRVCLSLGSANPKRRKKSVQQARNSGQLGARKKEVWLVGNRSQPARSRGSNSLYREGRRVPPAGIVTSCLNLGCSDLGMRG